jgi:hypothetical protein
MTTKLRRVLSLWALAAAITLISPAHAEELLIPGQVMVVNMIHPDQGSETRRDSEPNLAVNPHNPLQMAATAFTPNPSGESKAPIYVSTDGGRNWWLNPILPFNDTNTGTGDITLRFGTTSNFLYVAALEKPAYKLRILRSKDFTRSDVMELLTDYVTVDQPYVEAISVPVDDGSTEDRVYVAYSDRAGAGRKTATIQPIRNAATLSAPAGFVFKRIEKRDTCPGEVHGFDGPVRTAVHRDGTIYAAFFRYTAGCGTDKITADIVVARDNNWADSTDAFADLKDSDGLAGKFVARGVTFPFTDTTVSTSTRLGKQRIGGNISIAVDPTNSDRVYIAWADGLAPDPYTIRVRRSTDRGETWSGDLRTVTNATNPSLAINSRGKVGFLYQQLVACTAPEGCWETRLERSSDDFASADAGLLLHRAPDDISGTDIAGPLGEYNYLMAVETEFYGIFSGNNTPDTANFPQGVTYRRNAIFSSDPAVRGKLLASDGASVVASVDPFFFAVSEPVALKHCVSSPWLCDFYPKLERGLIKLKCLMDGCTVIDLISRNCQVKFNCPGCAPGGMCPPYYHLHLDGLRGAWRVGLLDSHGMPVAHRQFKSRTGIVVSFHPSKREFVDGRIGSYMLAFEMGSKGRVGAEYRVKARLTRGKRHYEPYQEQVARRPR